jgi:hypothetical protein
MDGVPSTRRRLCSDTKQRPPRDDDRQPPALRSIPLALSSSRPCSEIQNPGSTGRVRGPERGVVHARVGRWDPSAGGRRREGTTGSRRSRHRRRRRCRVGHPWQKQRKAYQQQQMLAMAMATMMTSFPIAVLQLGRPAAAPRPPPHPGAGRGNSFASAAGGFHRRSPLVRLRFSWINSAVSSLTLRAGARPLRLGRSQQ